MSCCEKAKSILKPILDEYTKQFEEQRPEKAAEYYEQDGVLVEIGKEGTYGREAIKQKLVGFNKLMGKSSTKVHNEHYQMTDDYIIVRADYESTTEKKGTVKGKCTQIWRKSNNTYKILHEEYTME